MTSETVKKLRTVSYQVILTVAILAIFEYVQGSFAKSAQAASIDYVDTENVKQDGANSEEHRAIKRSLDEKADQKTIDEVLKEVKYNRAQNDKIYDYLLKNK